MADTDVPTGQSRRDRKTLRLQDMVLDSEEVQAYLEGLVRVAAESFTPGYGDVFCGVTLIRPDSSATVASNSSLAQALNEVQHGFDDGPCLLAARTGATVYVTDFLHEERFPEYRASISRYGVRSALGVPVRLDADASAGLDFYATHPHAFDAQAISVAERFGREASRSLRLAVKTAELGYGLGRETHVPRTAPSTDPIGST